MEVRFFLHCRDVTVSRAFYAGIAWRHGGDVTDNDGSRVFNVELTPGVFLKIAQNPRASTAHASIEFLAFDVWALAERVEGMLPQHTGIVDTLPPGHYCGPYEYPGGPLLSIRDPDGHLLSFATW